ncbi:hypothetical protein BDZ89DRAFT_743586 [Hymenopellis radicata]|nr:hypothetical protein BDZ89DRAFT_743586 [Hymenopellis radicata]
MAPTVESPMPVDHQVWLSRSPSLSLDFLIVVVVEGRCCAIVVVIFVEVSASSARSFVIRVEHGGRRCWKNLSIVGRKNGRTHRNAARLQRVKCIPLAPARAM